MSTFTKPKLKVTTVFVSPLCASVFVCVSVSSSLCWKEDSREVQGSDDVVLLSKGMEKAGGRGRRYRAGRDAWAGLHPGLIFYTA